jgi:hypothetical protein
VKINTNNLGSVDAYLEFSHECLDNDIKTNILKIAVELM